MTQDAWTSGSGTPVININGHYIDAPADRPTEWEIVTEELAFMRLDGRHTGERIGAALVETIDRYKLRTKVGWATSDGAAVNRTANRVVERKLEDSTWQAKERDMMYVSFL